ncbi:hypothetical protein SmJEL517_g03088 [Synchytrium microbalum]|uniref:Membrane insertase YidC/Oxa/ALB C-terminal domain-containing protein n=1 Tax=Synchytrium microbalum TaxID=1806994 RepID=A0A507C8B5_9FUNG|nr:uncharacterized protein SmJEL517_g03088 [Synchytrium microbalum]TPX34236.1 hypothetical protein SmJEL517_g03088 [Synchytrium microbalum]
MATRRILASQVRRLVNSSHPKVCQKSTCRTLYTINPTQLNKIRHQFTNVHHHQIRHLSIGGWTIWGSSPKAPQAGIEKLVAETAAPIPEPAPIVESVAATPTPPPSSLIDETIVDFIPEAAKEEIGLAAVTKIGDLASIGLCHSTPIGLAEQFLEAIYVYSGVPWWGTIMIATLAVRFALFPLVVYQQRNAAKMNNIKPQLEELTARRNKATQDGDEMEKSKALQETANLFKANNVNPFGMMGPPLAQIPIFISFFFALRAMSELPVPGFDVGGILWFTDLTQCDPYYVLPVVATISMMGVLEISTMQAQGSQPAAQAATMKTVMRIMLILGGIFTANFPAGVFMYWIATNAFTWGSVLLLRQPKVRTYFQIPEMAQHPVKITSTGDVRRASKTEVYQMVEDARKRVAAGKIGDTKKFNPAR